MKNSASQKFQLLLGGLVLVFSSHSQGRVLAEPCSEINRQLKEKIQNREKALSKKQALESELRDSLKKEINAQIERRDSALEQVEAKRIYYELRKVRAEADYEDKKIAELKMQVKNCEGTKS